MNRISKLFTTRKQNILSVYFTAGFPNPDDTIRIIRELDKAGADMIEIGMPFSDPVADGPVIQRSSETALQNGMTLNRLFRQIEHVRDLTDIPLVLMGYVNPFYRFGFENLLEKCRTTGIDATIIPDLPVEEYLRSYEASYIKEDIYNILLVAPQTPDERIKYLDSISGGFIYLVSSSSTTGSAVHSDNKKTEYFKRIKALQLKTPLLTGFGISDRESFEECCRYSSGAIIGSAFIKALEKEGSIEEKVGDFVRSIRGTA
jgi:tryptophan synthase alpha chain